MQPITVIILPGGKTCREANPLERPQRRKCSDNAAYTRRCQKYIETESKLRTFEIEENKEHTAFIGGSEFLYYEGQNYQAQITTEGKARIL